MFILSFSAAPSSYDPAGVLFICLSTLGLQGLQTNSPIPLVIELLRAFLQRFNPMDSNNRDNKRSQSYHPSAVSPGDLLSSAEVVAEAATLAYHRDINKVDKGRAAGAAADLLHAASHYGHIEDKPFGQYIENAEGYLYQFQSSSRPSATYLDDEGGGDRLTETAKQKKDPPSMYQSAPAKHVPKKDDWYNKPGKHGYVASGNRFGHVDDESEVGDSGGYMKLAQTFLKKQGQHADMEDSEEGGFGNYMNLAQGLMKKY